MHSHVVFIGSFGTGAGSSRLSRKTSADQAAASADQPSGEGLASSAPDAQAEMVSRPAQGRELPEPIAGSDRPTREMEPQKARSMTLGKFAPPADSALPRLDISLGSGGAQIGKDEYTPAQISISNAGEYDIAPQPAGVRLRGNSTLTEAAKIPLKIKFDEKTAVFGRAAKKRWALLANAFDKTLIHNIVAYDLYDYLTPDGSFVSIVQPVDVYVNGQYAGVYTLCDQIEAGKSRLPIEKEPGPTPELTGFLIEHDYRASYTGWQKEGVEGETWFWLTRANECFSIESPDAEDYDFPASEYADYIKRYMDDVYETAFVRDWPKLQTLIDVDSFINGYMTLEICKSVDSPRSSVYFLKQPYGKLEFATIWDCDLTFGSSSEDRSLGEPEGYVAETEFFFEQLMGIPEFRKAYIARFNEIQKSALTHMLDKIQSEYDAHASSYQADYEYWETQYDWCSEEMAKLSSYDEQIAYMKDWITRRMEWLSAEYAAR